MSFVISADAQQDVVYFIPIPDQHLHECFKVLTDASGRSIANDIQSTVSMVVSEDATTITYDHWEDGYELDINNPTQSSTQIWGDGMIPNGNAATVCSNGCASDVLSAGSVIILENSVSIPRNSSIIKYDGRDKIASSRSLSVSRAGYSSDPGTVLADATEVIDFSSYDLEYSSPIGVDMLSSVDNNMFEFTALFIMAGENNTTVQIDADANGTFEESIVINQGESHKITDVYVGARILADKPVQTVLFTGDLGARFENRWFTLYPSSLWDNSYYNPVVSPPSPINDPTYVFLYNGNTSAISVQVETKNGNSTVVVPAKGVEKYIMPSNSGAHFITPGGENFFAVATTDSDASNTTHDWGLTLLPESYLTQSVVVGWGPGSASPATNGNPLWVLASSPTTVYIDYDADPNTGPLTDINGDKYDVAYTLDMFDFQKIYDPDNDQTGIRVYTCDGALIAAAWGQDPAVSGCCSPFLDMGTSVPPNLRVEVFKSASLTYDADSDGKADINDIITYNITMINRSLRTRNTINILDSLPANVDYNVNSTIRRTTMYGTTDTILASIPDDNLGTAFPLDSLGYTLGDLTGATKEEVEFSVTLTGLGENIVLNTAVVNTAQGEYYVTAVTTPVDASFEECILNFTDSTYSTSSTFLENTPIYFSLTAALMNQQSGTIDMLNVILENDDNGDIETITLSETGINTGIFHGSITSSNASGESSEDGIIKTVTGNGLGVSFENLTYGYDCQNTAIITAPSFTKPLYLSTDGSGSPDQDLDRVDPVATSDMSTDTSQVISGSCVADSVVHDNSSTGAVNNANSVTVSHTTGTGTNRVMLVASSHRDGEDATGATYGGTPLTLLGTFDDHNHAQLHLYYLINPSPGTADVVVSLDGNSKQVVGVSTFSGVDTTTLPFSYFSQEGNSGASTSVTATTAVGDMVYDIFALEKAETITPNASQTSRWDEETANVTSKGMHMGASTKLATSTSTNMSWTSSDPDHFALVAVVLKPASSCSSGEMGGGGTIVHDNSSKGVVNNASSVTVSHTTGTASDRIMIVASSHREDEDPTGVTYGGTSLTLLATLDDHNHAQLSLYYMANPPSGTANVVVSLVDDSHQVVGVTTFSGVNTTSLPPTYFTQEGDNGDPTSVNATTNIGDLVFDIFALEKAATITPDGSQTLRWDEETANVTSNGMHMGGSTKLATSSTTTMEWTSSDPDHFALAAIVLEPASAASSSNVTYESSTEVKTNGGSLNFSHTFGGDSDPLLMVGIAHRNGTGGNGNRVSSVTFDGTNLTRLISEENTDYKGYSEIWYLPIVDNPGTNTTANIIISGGSSPEGMYAVASNFSGVDQSTPFGSSDGDNDDSGSPSVSVGSVMTGDLVVDMVSLEDDVSTTPGSGQTLIQTDITNDDKLTGGMSRESGTGSISMTWSNGPDKKWTITSTVIKPSLVSISNNPDSTVFTQVPTMCTDLELPVGGTVSATLYIEELVGSFGANGIKDVQALLKKDNDLILDLEEGTWDNTEKTFTWTGTLPSAITIDAGEAVSVIVTSSVGGVDFVILFDSEDYPSKINLPTTTVISIDSLAVYDAPYPMGSSTTSAINGSQVYIRATVSDPFGPDDITSMDLEITNPFDSTTTFTAIPVADTLTCAKVFEYCWQTPTQSGNYDLLLTAKEGYEDEVIDQANMLFNLTQDDLGTPCALQFTDASYISTSTYGLPSTVYVELIDADKDDSISLAEIVQVTITTTNGDSETIDLTETGVSTGIFRGSIAASVSGVNIENGVLNSALGNTLTVTYIDSEDPGDVCLDYATFPSLSPSSTLTKTRLEPSDDIANVGDPVQFRLVLSNTGNSVLSGITLTDNFSASCLTYDSASISPSSVSSGMLTWSSLSIPIGGNVIIDVNFTGTGTVGCIPTNNISASTGGGVPNIADTAFVNITNPSVAISKTRITSLSADIGDTVSFDILIMNDGNTALTTVPLIDEYSAFCLEFISATEGGFPQSPDGSGSGLLLWNNIGPLSIGQSKTFNLKFVALNGCTPAENEASVSSVSDVYGDEPPNVSDTDTVTIIENPVIGLAKSLTSVVYNGSESYTINIRLTIENFGDVPLSEIEIFDDISTQFGAYSPTAFNAIDGSLIGNGSWNGTSSSNILATGQSLYPSTNGTVNISFNVTVPTTATVDNTATTYGTSPVGTIVMDVSTDGIDPDGNDNDDVPDEITPTPVFISQCILPCADFPYSND